jgi:thioesterase domain-containing protein
VVRRFAHAIRPDGLLPPLLAASRASASLIGDRRFAANVAMAARHRARHADVDTLLIRGSDSRSTIDSDRWSEVVGNLVVEELAGSHTSLLVEPYVSDVALTIRDILRSA